MHSLNLDGDVVALLQQLIDIESVSGNEGPLADAMETALRALPALEVTRNGDAVVARTDLGRERRVILAGHLDTVPLVAGSLPSRLEGVGDSERVIGRGSCDMKAGVAVFANMAPAIDAAIGRGDALDVDVTWVFYDHEEVEDAKNGLGRLVRETPELLAGDFALLGEPSNAGIEGGCQGTLRIRITAHGRASHSARAWKGVNAIHGLAPVLTRLAAYEPRVVTVDGLEYHEGLNAVNITGGIATNVIPDAATVEVNLRYAPDRDDAEAVPHLLRSAGVMDEEGKPVEGYSWEITDHAHAARPGLESGIAAEFLKAAGGRASAKYGWTDVARFATLGIPAVNFGPGDPSLAHTDEEWCPTADVHECRRVLLTWLGLVEGNVA